MSWHYYPENNVNFMFGSTIDPTIMLPKLDGSFVLNQESRIQPDEEVRDVGFNNNLTTIRQTQSIEREFVREQPGLSLF